MTNASRVDTEHLLVKAAQAGDRGAFDRLICNYVDSVTALVRSKVPGEDAVDVVQEVLLAMIEMLPNLKEPRAFRGSLWTIARRRIADYHRSRTSVALVRLSEGADLDIRAQGALTRVEDRLIYEEALRDLPRCSRVIVRLHLERQRPFAEVARRIGVSEAAARIRYHRAISKIRRVAM